LHTTYLTATTMTFAGIVACQVGAGLAARTTRASLRQIGVFTNRLLLYGIAFELVFAAALIYIPALQTVFHTAPLSAGEIAVLATFAVIVWATDELRRWWLRRRDPAPASRLGSRRGTCPDEGASRLEQARSMNTIEPIRPRGA
jgi:magnesium-transporting ATPase (P-type)